MKKINVVFDFIRIPILSKVGRGKDIVDGMKGNPRFPSPDVALDDLEEATGQLERTHVAASGGGKTNKALMHQAEKAWDQLMRDEALYVDRIAKGDHAVILSAGFNFSRTPIPAKRPEFSAALGEKSGSVILHCKAIQGAYAYVWQYCKGTLAETEAGWTYSNATGKATVTLLDQVPITKYWYRVAAVLADGTAAYCEPISIVIG
jgi:hypothetical protein